MEFYFNFIIKHIQIFYTSTYVCRINFVLSLSTENSNNHVQFTYISPFNRNNLNTI